MIKMTEHTPEKDNRGENLRQLRGYLRLTQKEFLNEFLTDKTGKARFSVATLSNLESKGGRAMPEVVEAVAGELGLEAEDFTLDPEAFLQKLDERKPRMESFEAVTEEKGGNTAALVNQLTDYFADEMLAGRLHRGDQVEPDRALAARFSVGRSALREAMKVLDIMGLVDIRPGQGTFLSSRDSDFFLIPISWSVFLSAAQIDQVLTMRDLLECQAAYLAALYRSEETAQKLGELLEKSLVLAEEKDHAGLSGLDIDFHFAIAGASGNRVIQALLNTIRNLLEQVSRSGMADDRQIGQIREEHQAVYRAILAGDAPAARDAMQAHMRSSRKRYTY